MNGWLDDSIQGFADRFNTAVANLDAQVTQMAATEAQLWDVQPYVQSSGDAALQRDWDAAMQRIIATGTTVESVRAQVQTVAGWWQGVRSSFSGVQVSVPGVLSGMGLLPAIPWSVVAALVGGAAAVAGAIYAASKVIDSVRRRELQAENVDRTNRGEPPLADVAPPDTGGMFAGLSDAVMWAVGGAVLLMLLNRGK